MEHSITRQPAAGIIDEILHLVTLTVNYLNQVARIENTPLLLALLSQLCSVSGIVLQLKNLSQNENAEFSWSLKMGALCVPSGPLQDLVLELRTFARRLSRCFSRIRQLEASGPLIRNIDVTKLKSSFETQKTILLYALQNEPRYVGVLVNE